MADVELVIKIPEEKYNEIHSLKFVQYGLQSEENKKFFYLLINAIQDGVLLPKGHGRLIDADTLKKDDEVTEWISLNPVRTGKTLKSFSELFIKKIDATKTIIEADKESEE